MSFITHLLYIPTVILNALIRGYVLTQLWLWFLVAQFEMVPKLSVVGAVGLVILFNLFKAVPSGKYPFAKSTTVETDSEANVSVFDIKRQYWRELEFVLITLICWLSGYLWHFFM